MSSVNLITQMEKLSKRDPSDYKIGIIKSILGRRQNGEETPINSDLSSDDSNQPVIRELPKKV